MAMNTDVAVLAKEAANFERISGELRAVIGHVEATAGGLHVAMQGDAGTAAQAALLRFQEAADRQVQQLTEISANIQSAGMQYAATDDDQAAAVASAMQF